jgi:hypothetical protein
MFSFTRTGGGQTMKRVLVETSDHTVIGHLEDEKASLHGRFVVVDDVTEERFTVDGGVAEVVELDEAD